EGAPMFSFLIPLYSALERHPTSPLRTAQRRGLLSATCELYDILWTRPLGQLVGSHVKHGVGCSGVLPKTASLRQSQRRTGIFGKGISAPILARTSSYCNECPTTSVASKHTHSAHKTATSRNWHGSEDTETWKQLHI